MAYRLFDIKTHKIFRNGTGFSLSVDTTKGNTDLIETASEDITNLYHYEIINLNITKKIYQNKYNQDVYVYFIR